MTLRLGLAAAAALLAALLVLRSAPASAPAPPPVARVPVPPVTAPPPHPPPDSVRNVFTYALPADPGGGEDAPADPVFDPPDEEAEPPASADEELVRLVGLVRKGGRLKAAVAIAGQIVVLGPGDSAEGYALVSVDEDTGARLRTPEGADLVLPVPAS